MGVPVNDDINAFLDAYPSDVVRAALKERNRRRREQKTAGEWKDWNGNGLPPPPYDWAEINGVVKYRERPQHGALRRTARETPGPKKKTDTALRRNPDMRCPFCGAETFFEPLCPACKEGRAGMAARIICGENDDHVFYVPRGGE